MADPKVAVKLTADPSHLEAAFRRASSAAQTSGKQIESAFSGLKTIAGALGIGIGLYEFVNVLKEVAAKTIDEQRSLNQLNATLIATGRSAGVTAGELKELADELQRSSVFDDDSIRKAEIALLRFRSVQGETFADIMRLGPDAATVLGTDLPNAVQILARAIENPSTSLRQLKKAGVEVSEQQIDLAASLKATGDNAASAKIIIDAISRSFGGAAQSDTVGLYGATKRASRAWDDLQKSLGRTLFGEQGQVVDQLALKLQHLAEVIDKLDRRKGHQILVEQSGQAVSGKIRGMKEAEEAWAAQAASVERQKQATDQAYLAQQAFIKKRADNAATFYGAELAAQKHFLAMGTIADEDAYSQRLITADAFYAKQIKKAQDAATAEANALGKQAFAQAEFRDSLGADKTEERAQANQKIIALDNQMMQVWYNRDQQILQLTNKRSAAVRELADSYDDLAIKIAEAQGDVGQATALSFDKASRNFRETLEAIAKAGGEGSAKAAQSLVDLSGLRQQQVLQAELTKALNDFGVAADRVGNQQQRIALQVASGQITELDGLYKLSAANRAAIPDLTQLAEKYEELGRQLGGFSTEAGTKALAAADALRLKIEELAAATDLVGKKFTSIFESNFVDGLVAVADGTKSVKDAFHDMAKSIVHDINEIAAKQLAKALFGESGALGGLGGFFASLFGGSAGSLFGGAPAMPANVAPGFDPLGFFGFPAFAQGSNFVPRDMLATIHKGEAIVPADINAKRPLGKSNVININVNVLPGASRATADQAAVAAGRQVNRALYRNS